MKKEREDLGYLITGSGQGRGEFMQDSENSLCQIKQGACISIIKQERKREKGKTYEDSPAVRAKGTVSPSARPIIASRTSSLLLLWCSNSA
jgi:hypothetical protein